jgi:hypothetical protein
MQSIKFIPSVMSKGVGRWEIVKNLFPTLILKGGKTKLKKRNIPNINTKS